MFAESWQRDHGKEESANMHQQHDRKVSGVCSVISTVFWYVRQVMADGAGMASGLQVWGCSGHKHRWLAVGLNSVGEVIGTCGVL